MFVGSSPWHTGRQIGLSETISCPDQTTVRLLQADEKMQRLLTVIAQQQPGWRPKVMLLTLPVGFGVDEAGVSNFTGLRSGLDHRNAAMQRVRKKECTRKTAKKGKDSRINRLYAGITKDYSSVFPLRSAIAINPMRDTQ